MPTVGGICTAGDRAISNGFWFECIATADSLNYMTVLTEAITYTISQTIYVYSTASIYASDVIKIDNERMHVLSVVGKNELSVSRGYGGTTAATHSISASVYVFFVGESQNAWRIVQPTCAEINAAGTLSQSYTFVSTGLSTGAKIAGDYPLGVGHRHCYVYDSTTKIWSRKMDADCGTTGVGDAWNGCTQCITNGNVCTTANECCSYDEIYTNAFLCEATTGSSICISCDDCSNYWGGGTISCTVGQTHCGGVVTCVGLHFTTTGTCPVVP